MKKLVNPTGQQRKLMSAHVSDTTQWLVERHTDKVMVIVNRESKDKKEIYING